MPWVCYTAALRVVVISVEINFYCKSMGEHIRVLVRENVERLKEVRRHAAVNGHRNTSDEYYNNRSISSAI